MLAKVDKQLHSINTKSSQPVQIPVHESSPESRVQVLHLPFPTRLGLVAGFNLQGNMAHTYVHR